MVKKRIVKMAKKWSDIQDEQSGKFLIIITLNSAHLLLPLETVLPVFALISTRSRTRWKDKRQKRKTKETQKANRHNIIKNMCLHDVSDNEIIILINDNKLKGSQSVIDVLIIGKHS